MSYERQNGVPRRRLPPSSATSSQSPKWNGKGSSLPKVAGSPATNGYIFGRRESQVEGAVKEPGSPEEFVATPMKPFLSSNVTPRSGSRKARAETASPTLHGTPHATPESWRFVGHGILGEESETSGLGLRSSNAGRISRAGSSVSDGPGVSVSNRPAARQRNSSTSRASSREPTPKFFHMNDIKPVVPTRSTSAKLSTPDRLPSVAQFNDSCSPNDPPSSLGSTSTHDEHRTKFFYVNDSTDPSPPPLRLTNGNSSSRPQLQTIYSAHTASSPPRASSPLKEEVLPRKSSVSKASPRRHTRLVSSGGSELKSPETTLVGKGSSPRRSSLNSAKPIQLGSHVRSPSVQSAGPTSSRRPSIALSDGSPVERSQTTSLVGANGALPHSVNPPSTTQEVHSPQLPSRPQSPTKSIAGGQSKIEQLNELAANARRERKVLDLEISNSSLLAINRTLEREMRKQNAELRRFRRLSRSGRVSIAPTSRSVSGKMSVSSETDRNNESNGPVSSSEDEDDTTGPLSSLSSPSSTSRPSSPLARAGRARFQDPDWIELDLAMHRALLLDSQKLNTSIKRCLAHSESLISSGRRALEFQVRPPKSESEPNVEDLGARVLTPDEIDDDTLGQGQGLLSPVFDQAGFNPWERSLGSAGSVNSGFETPDYSKWGPSTEVQKPFTDSSESLHQSTKETRTIETSNNTFDRAQEGHFQNFGHKARRASDIASIDGLDEVPSIHSVDSRDIRISEVDGDEGQSANDKFETPEPIAMPVRMGTPKKPPDPQPGQPGYRGSMQGLGHYLQAFSIFGTAQQT